ncbi:MAG: M48 family metallopeptidase [Planctomycetia bacterium]|nr:M48 family metallopeptidase [Planctomycetia bacterium]
MVKVPSFMQDDLPSDSSNQSKQWDSNDCTMFIHPEDMSAMNALKAVPGFEGLVRKVMAGTIEKMFYGECLGTNIKLGPSQLPEFYQLLPPVCEKFNIPVPPLFLEMSPIPNAYTYGDKVPFIVMSSGLLEYMSKEEVQIVLAHECGHIVCHHSLYTMMSVIIGYGLSWIPTSLTELLKLPIYRWRRMSEFSADRAGAVFAGNAQKYLDIIIRLSGGKSEFTKRVNTAAYQEQVNEYDAILNDTAVESAMQSYLLLWSTHPFASMRSREILNWTKGATFSYLSKKVGTYSLQCPQCGAPMRGRTNICTNGHFC